MSVNTLNNRQSVGQNKQNLVNDKLSNDESTQYLDGWPFNNSMYNKEKEACVRRSNAL